MPAAFAPWLFPALLWPNRTAGDLAVAPGLCPPPVVRAGDPLLLLAVTTPGTFPPELGCWMFGPALMLVLSAWRLANALTASGRLEGAALGAAAGDTLAPPVLLLTLLDTILLV
jgi:hypothetical protein